MLAKMLRSAVVYARPVCEIKAQLFLNDVNFELF
jgi:hypothetical protein